MVIKMKYKKTKTSVVQDVPEEQNDIDAGTKEKIPQEIKIIAQEVQIVRALACNDVNKRNRQIRKLRKWLQLRARSTFTFSEDDFLRIWKGLYYNMWMSDKPLVQEELAEQLGQLLQCFDGDVELSVNFFGAFMRTMCQEWFGIDQWRIDKFLMLTRRMLRYMFRVLNAAHWSKESIQRFNEHMKLTVLADNSPATGLTMHYLDIFFEELAKVSDGKIDAEQVGEFVRPFVTFLGTQRDMKLVAHCRTRVLNHLLYQSALGREYSEKYNAWKEMGFPTSSIKDLEKVENDESLPPADEEEGGAAGDNMIQERLLDPRAGNVDVFMPELPLDAKYIIDELESLLYKHEFSTKCRKMLKKQLNLFQIYQLGNFPLGVKTMPRIKLTAQQPLIKDKVEQLENLENELYGVGRKLKQLNKRKRRKLLKSLNFDEIDESNFDQIVMKAIPKQYLKEKERKKRAQLAMMTGWIEEEIDEGDMPARKKFKPSTEKNENEQEKKTVAANKLQQKKSIIEKSDDEPAKIIKKVDQISTTTAQQSQATEKKNKVDTPKKHKAVDLVNGNSDPVKAQKSAENLRMTNKSIAPTSEWDKPLAAGEIEYFIPSRKVQLKKSNSELVLNPLARKSIHSATTATYTPPSKHTTTSAIGATNSRKTPGSVKRVKIALKHNTMQNPSEYIKQIKSSPNVPYDAERKPGKGLLKPNSIPSPINPFYKKKIGLRLLNDTM